MTAVWYGFRTELRARWKSADIVSYERVRTTPLVLAGVLALLAIATVTHALVTAERRRRRDLALLKALGFVPGRLAARLRPAAVLRSE